MGSEVIINETTPYTVSQRSIPKRVAALRDISSVISQEGNEKLIYTSLVYALAACDDPVTTKELKVLTEKWCYVSPKTAGAVLIKALSTVLPSVKLPQYNKLSSRNGLVLLDVSCSLLSMLSDMFFSSDGALKALLPILSCSFAATVGTGYHKHCSRALRAILSALKSDGEKIEKLVKTMLRCELTPWDLPFLSSLVFQLHFHHQNTAYTGVALDKYIELLFLTKARVHEHLVLSSSRGLMKAVSHELFTEKILPGMRRAALRTAELAVPAFHGCLSGLDIDMSRYTSDMIEVLGPLMASPNEAIHSGGKDCMAVLYTGISDSGAATLLVDGVFGILEGSKGKIAAYKQRESVMSIIEGFANLTITGESAVEAITLHVLGRLEKYLKAETNDTVLFATIKAYGIWGSLLKREVPKNVTETFKQAFLKGSSAMIRINYHCAADKVFNKQNIPSLEIMESTLMAIVEKTASNTILSVVEGICAGALLLKLTKADLGIEDDIHDLITKKFFCNDVLNIILAKILPSCQGPEVALVEYFFQEAVLQIEISPEVRSVIVHGMLNILFTKDYSAQKLAIQSLRYVLKEDSTIVDEILEYLKSEVVNYTNTEENMFRSKKFVKIIEQIFSVFAELPVDVVEDVFLRSLLFTNNPELAPFNSQLTVKLAYICAIDLYKFGEKYSPQLLELITVNATAECYRMIGVLCGHCLTLITPLINSCLECFEKNSLKAVSLEDLEIHRTPKGTLWLSSMLDEFEKSKVVDKNIKRESKLYTMEDQKWEQEMRAKLQKQTGLKLTKKQQDDVNHRLELENAIREHVQTLQEEFVHRYHVIMSVLDVNLDHLMYSVSRLSSISINMLSYPITASRSINLLMKLMLKVFPYSFKALAHLLARVTIRLYDPPCQVDQEWCEESLEAAFGRCITRFRQMLETGFTLPSAAYSLAFPFLSYIVSKSDMTDERYEENASIALNVVLAHVKKRASQEKQFDGPSFMPLRELIKMSCATFERKPVGVIGKSLLEVLNQSCLAANGDPGCAIAGPEEISTLIKFLISENDVLRLNVLQNLLLLNNPLSVLVLPENDVDSLSNKISTSVWMCKSDISPKVKEAASLLWEDPVCNFKLFFGICDGLIELTMNPHHHIQVAASKSLKEFLTSMDQHIDFVLLKLIQLYTSKSEVPQPVRDEMGRVIIEAARDNWEERLGLTCAMMEIVPYLVNEQILTLINLIVNTGLSDNALEVKVKMREVGEYVIDVHGELVIDILLPVFENYLDTTPDSRATDGVKQNVVILMASLARHLSKDDPKVKPIVCKLMESLSTPSEQVQIAVGKCLAPLVPAIKDISQQLIERILYQLLESEAYGERRGASYGLAGIVKGLGLLSLKQMKIMPVLIEAIQNKKEFRHREGALMAFEQLSAMMGPLFEPYVINVLPHLLNCFGDGNPYVRQATDKASRTIMEKLSGHGVKLVLPSLLKALAGDSWRTKCGSVELLGKMAFCNPKQLSSCLPNIVPKLIEVMADSHNKVQRASQEALKQIGSVIKNPEIQAIVQFLLDALSEPSKYTSKCLSTLLKTSFVHRIDAPSLALIIPVLTRSFDQRTDTKKSAAQIVGNILELTDEKDLKPYLDSIIPGLKGALLDPVPDVRLYSAKALGCLVRGIGEIPNLMDWLLNTLVSEQSSVDRSGAAQGISEVMVGLGPEKLESTMGSVLEMLDNDDLPPNQRDGYLMLFIYFPISMKEDFADYIDEILDPILSGLASESEFVRDTSYKAGQKIVQIYADCAINLFLPRLENGLFNDNHRIRLASCCLLGDLLYKIMGVSGKQSTVSADEDDNFGTDETKKIIIEVLGKERRNRVFSGLYMARSDVALQVRQAALHIWKIVVSNTPKTLKEILPVLIEMILSCLASEVYDKRSVASRTLGDLVKKLGDRILPEVIPILEKSLSAEDFTQRQGVCLGLSEILSATSKDQVDVYSASLLPAIRKALVDTHAEVRSSAASTFAALHNVLGSRALDEILSPLLKMMETLEGEEADNLIDALKEIMTAKSRVVLPYMVPKLVQKPVNIAALASLSSVANDALHDHIDLIIRSVVQGLCDLEDKEAMIELEHGKAIVTSIRDENGHSKMLDTLESLATSEDPKTRRYCAYLLASFCSNTTVNIEEFIKDLWKILLGRFSDEDPEIVKVCWEAFNTATKRLLPGDQVRLVPDLRTAVSMSVDMKNKRDASYTLPGFCLPKGIHAIVALYREGILNGTPELKEHSILGIKEAIQLTNTVALKPSVVQITGPLIRVLGERYVPNIKAACLDALSLLIDKVKIALKPFLSQLQTTFMKSLHDTNRDVRNKGVNALTKLVTFHNKVDNLFTDLHSGTKNTDLSIRETMLSALHGTMLHGGSNMSQSLAHSISTTLATNIGAPEDAIRIANGACIGSLASFFGEEELLKFINDNIISGGGNADAQIKHGRAMALAGLFKYSPDRICKLEILRSIVMSIAKLLDSDKVPVCNSACYAASHVIIHLLKRGDDPDDCMQHLLTCLVQNCSHGTSNDIRSFANNMVHMISISTPGVDPPLSDQNISKFLVPLLDSTTRKIPLVRSSSESAIATLLQLNHGDEIVERVKGLLDNKSLDTLYRFLPTARRVANDYRTYSSHEDDLFGKFSSKN